MGNTIMEMHSELSPRRYSPPKKSRAWSIPAVDFVYELQSVDKCGYFDWPLHVWPTTDGKKFIIPVADHSLYMISDIICSLVHAKRSNLLEKIHFVVYVSNVASGYWVGISPTKLDNDNLMLSLLMRCVIMFILRSLINHDDLIEYLERYSTPYLKYLIKKELDYFINRTKDKLEIRMYLMRYIQDAPQHMKEEGLAPFEEALLHWRLDMR